VSFLSFNLIESDEITSIKRAITGQKAIESLWKPQGPEMFATIVPSSLSHTIATETLVSDISVFLDGKTVLPYYYQFDVGAYYTSPYRYDLSWLEKLQERDITEVTGEREKELLPDWLEKALEKIAEIRQLPQDWDSYGSLPPNPLLCDLAVRLLFDIRELDVPEPFVAPSSGGLIYIKMKFRHRELVIKLYDPSGRYAKCLRVETLPTEDIYYEKTIYLRNEFRKKVLWLLGEVEQIEMAA
jgi:esterase/lipase superfamily enzyme